jgi:hypothetical protein
MSSDSPIKVTGLMVRSMVMGLTAVRKKHLLVFGRMDKLSNKSGCDIFDYIAVNRIFDCRY